MKTLESLKEEIATAKGYPSWEKCINDQPSYGVEKVMDEVARLYALEKCKEQRIECSRCLEADIPKGPTHNLVLYANTPTFL